MSQKEAKEEAKRIIIRFTISRYDPEYPNYGWYEDDTDSVSNAIITVEEILRAIPKGTIWNEKYWNEVLEELKNERSKE